MVVQPITRPETVDAVSVIHAEGPFRTKSDGQLLVHVALPHAALAGFFSWNPDELARVPEGFEMRGLRSYSVRNLPLGPFGGTEFHRLRNEIVLGLDGEIDWECEDVYGNVRRFTLTPGVGVRMPPFILHTYWSRKPQSGLYTVVNTMFGLDHPVTRDTYSVEEFRELQSMYAHERSA